MTTINLQAIVPLQVTGLLATTSATGIILSWISSNDPTDQYEIWTNTTNYINVPSYGTLLGTISTNSFNVNTLPFTSSNYFWVRIKNRYGAYGFFSSNGTNYSIGSQFNTLKVALSADSSSSTVTQTNINQIQAQVWYLDSDGNAQTTGITNFTSTLSDAVIGGTTAWVNPDYARTNDSYRATCSSYITTHHIVGVLSDLNVPATGHITGIEFFINGATTNPTFVNLRTGLYNSSLTTLIAPSWTYPAFTGTGYQTLTIGSQTTDLGLIGGGLQATMTPLATSAITTTSFSAGSMSTSLSVGASTSTVYDAWTTIMTSPSFTAIDNNSMSIYAMAKIVLTSLSCTSAQGIDISFRWFLSYGSGAEVPTCMDTIPYYSQTGSVINYNQTPAPIYVNRAFYGNGGVLVTGTAYTYRLQYLMARTIGTPTCTISYSGSISSESIVLI